MKCKYNPFSNATAIYYINPKDVKSYEPFVLKRKYGKFKRVIYKEQLN